jgi:hypothetical protein
MGVSGEIDSLVDEAGSFEEVRRSDNPELHSPGSFPVLFSNPTISSSRRMA